MKKIFIPEQLAFNEQTSEFITIKATTLVLEHSLISISKWESKWHKPFLSKDRKTTEETIDYIRCMTLNPNVDENVYSLLTNDNLTEIDNYINDPMTATTVNDNRKGGRKEIITSELIYCWMIELNIPFQCEKWHLNRLLMMVKVCDVRNAPQKKMSQREIMSRNAALNAKRRAQLNTRG